MTISHSASATPESVGLGGSGYSPVVSFTPAVITAVPGTCPSSKGFVSGAMNLTVDGGDAVYIADTGNSLARHIDSSGNISNIGEGFTNPLAIAVDNYGEVYLGVPAANAIYSLRDFSRNQPAHRNLQRGHHARGSYVNGVRTDGNCNQRVPCGQSISGGVSVSPAAA